MGSIAEIIADLEYGRSTLLAAIEGLSRRELTEKNIYPEWTIKDVLAHIVGWDHRVIKILPLIVQDKADQVPGVDVPEQNRRSVAAWRDKSFDEVLAEIHATHRQILEFIGSLDHVEIDRRHNRNGRVITIRSYILDIMTEHERRHAMEIEQWRKQLEQEIDPAAVLAQLRQARSDFMLILDRLTEADATDKQAVGGWSISDLTGHVADWEQRMLGAARHIQDPSFPAVPPVADESANWNDVLASNRAQRSWSENYHYLRRTQRALEDFLAKLTPEDWKQRGPYPWPNDQGTLAELITHAAGHYTRHLPDVENWYNKRQQNP